MRPDVLGVPIVPPRKAIAALRETPDRIETLLRWCTEKDASRPLRGGAGTVRAVVARLGTLERFCFLEASRRIASGAPTPALPGFHPDPTEDAVEREISEWITRFRHVRAQSVAFLEVVEPESFDRAGLDPDFGEVSLARIVSAWVANDAEALQELSAAKADPGPQPG